MSRKHFSLLLAVTIVVAAAVLLMPGKTGRESDIETTRWLPELQESVNELDWVRVVGPGDETIVTLKRGDGYWQVEEAHGYRADWNRLRTLLVDLSQAEVVERKTSNPEYYARLGVEDVAQSDASGLMIEFSPATSLPAIIVGNRSQGRDGHYVRLRDSANSLLIDRSLEVARAATDWLDDNVVSIADTEVVEVEISHPDGERVRALKRSADDDDFELQDAPEGREIQSAWTVNSLANGLASLTFEAVAPADDIDWTPAVRFGLVTADGVRMDAELVRIETAAESGDAAAEHWMRMQAGIYQTAVESGVEADDDGGAAAERAQSINQRVEGWAYRVPKYKYDGMTKRMEDLLKAAEDSAE